MAGAYQHALYEAAQLAMTRAAESAQRQLRTLRGGVNSFYPIVDEESCRFGIGIVEEYEYLAYQDTGIRTFTMTALKGKTVPMYINGILTFRKVTNVNRYKPGPPKRYWYRDADGELVPRMEQPRRWVHPGLAPKHFVQEGIEQAAGEMGGEIFRALMEDLEGERG